MEQPVVVAMRIEGTKKVLLKKYLLPTAPREGERIALSGTPSLMYVCIEEVTYEATKEDGRMYTVVHGVLESHTRNAYRAEKEDIEDIIEAGWRDANEIIKTNLDQSYRFVEEIVFSDN